MFPGPLPTPPSSWNQLNGPLSPALGAGWGDLEELSLDSNAFSGQLPAEWGAMGRLKKVYLQ